MNKRNIIIIVSILGLLLVGVVGYFVFGRQTGTPVEPGPTTSPGSSYMPIASEAPMFSPTPSLTPTGASGTLCPVAWTGMDSDGDGLPDTVEAIYKTDPANPDSDSDGYKDGDEIKNGYDPMNSGSVRLDSDKDGLLDNEECKYGANPLVADTDGDGFKDGEEIKNGYDPIKPGSARIGDTATPIPTPISSGGLTFGDPTPTPGTLPTNAPTTKPTTISTTLDLVKRSELKISSNSNATAIKTYLSAIDKASPADLITGSKLPDALTSAFKGDASKLLPIITRLQQHEQLIIAISTPEAAVTHQILLVSLVRFVNAQLNIIATTAGKNVAQQYNAALELQKKLSANMGLLSSERNKLQTLAR